MAAFIVTFIDDLDLDVDGALKKTETVNGIFKHHYPLVNKQFDPENQQFLMETSLPTPICQGLC